MLKASFLVGLIAACFLTSGCEDQKGVRKDLPSVRSAAYKISIITGEDPDSIAQPFKLEVRRLQGGGPGYQILSAEQCKNVDIFQDKHTMTISYDILALDHFSGDDDGEGVPRALLCDNHYPVCQRIKSDYKKRGVAGIALCTLR